MLWQLRTAFDTIEQLPMDSIINNLLNLLTYQLVYAKSIRSGSNPARQLFICLLHLFCAALLDLEWNAVAVVDIPRNAQSFLCSSECRGHQHWNGSHQHLISPLSWSDTSLYSINLIMRISLLLGFVPEALRYLSEWFLRICLTFPSAFVRRAFGRGWSNYRVALSRSDSCDYLSSCE